MNNLLKSLFISGYSMYVMGASALGINQLLREPGLAWVAMLLVHLPMAFLFAWLLVFRNMPRSHPYLPIVSAITLAGAALAATAAARGAAGPPVLLSAAGLATYLLYLFWYCRFGRHPSARLQVGGRLPAFEAIDSEGRPFRTQDLAGRPAVLMFFRGNWCPLCMAQIREVADGYRALAARDIRVVLISPQSQSKSARLAKRFDAPLTFVVDEGNRIAQQLGLAWRHALPAGMQLLGYDSESVLPTVVVLDAAGQIVMAEQTDNYRVRPEPATFIAALDQT